MSRVLKKNVFLAVVPTQSVHRSCSIESEKSDWDMTGAAVGAARGTVTVIAEARDPSEEIVKATRQIITDGYLEKGPRTGTFICTTESCASWWKWGRSSARIHVMSVLLPGMRRLSARDGYWNSNKLTMHGFMPVRLTG